jgi:hypothetical protein
MGQTLPDGPARTRKRDAPAAKAAARGSLVAGRWSLVAGRGPWRGEALRAADPVRFREAPVADAGYIHAAEQSSSGLGDRRSPRTPRRRATAAGIERLPKQMERVMSYVVDFTNVSTIGLASSPVATALAGLRANEARYFKNKYGHDFTVRPASEAREAIDLVHRILKEERGIVISSRPLEATAFQVEDIRWTYVFYESGLSINVLYTIDDASKRAVGFKLSDGMEVPAELGAFKFVRQKSKLAGTIRGSYFVIKGEY